MPIDLAFVLFDYLMGVQGEYPLTRHFFKKGHL
jgi:hypothetical protein